MLQEISTAQLIVADVTGRNPNVFYELGLAHTRKDARRVLLLTQNLEDVPIDLRQFLHISYRKTQPGLKALRERLTRAAADIIGPFCRFTVPRGGSHVTEFQFDGSDRALYSVEVSEIKGEHAFAKCRIRLTRLVIGRRNTVVLNSGFAFELDKPRPLYDRLPWRMRLDSVGAQGASFSIFKEAPPPRARAKAARRR